MSNLPNLGDFVALLSYEQLLKEIAALKADAYIRRSEFVRSDEAMARVFEIGIPMTPFEVTEFGEKMQLPMLVSLCLVQADALLLYAVMARTADLMRERMVAKGFEDSPQLLNLIRTVLFTLMSQAFLAYNAKYPEDPEKIASVRFVKVLSVSGLLDFSVDEELMSDVIRKTFSTAGKKEEANT